MAEDWNGVTRIGRWWRVRRWRIRRMNIPIWIQRWEKTDGRQKASISMGLILIIIASLLLGYIRNRAVMHSDSFYQIRFRLNFLEDIRTGAGIRYQGGLIVGKVQDIEINNGHFIIYADVAKNFKIPKIGSRASLKTWGYFGAKYINIDIILPEKELGKQMEYYAENDEILIDEVINLTIMMDKFAQIMAKSDSDVSILENKLDEIKRITHEIKIMSLQTRYEIKNNNYKTMAINAMNKFRDIARQYLQIVEDMDQFNYDVSIGLSKEIPQMKKSVLFWGKFSRYDENAEYYDFIHSEEGYDTMLAYIKEVNAMMKLYKKKPYKMIF